MDSAQPHEAPTGATLPAVPAALGANVAEDSGRDLSQGALRQLSEIEAVSRVLGEGLPDYGKLTLDRRISLCLQFLRDQRDRRDSEARNAREAEREARDRERYQREIDKERRDEGRYAREVERHERDALREAREAERQERDRRKLEHEAEKRGIDRWRLWLAAFSLTASLLAILLAVLLRR